MESKSALNSQTIQTELTFDFGTFEGFNFRTQSAICKNLTAQEVVAWNHDDAGEAEFWPAGDREEVALIFKGQDNVSGCELLELQRLLSDLGGEALENWVRIYYALRVCGDCLETLTAREVEDLEIQIYFGQNFTDLRRETAYELFELYFPDAYHAWEKSTCDGLIFDTDRFLDSPSFSTEEIRFTNSVALIVQPQ